METVDEFEAERNQQSQAEKTEGAYGQRLADGLGIVEDAPAGIGQPAQQGQDEDEGTERMRLVFKLGPRWGGGGSVGKGFGHGGVSTQWIASK